MQTVYYVVAENVNFTVVVEYYANVSRDALSQHCARNFDRYGDFYIQTMQFADNFDLNTLKATWYYIEEFELEC